MQKNYNENLVAGAAIRDDKGRRISKLFESTHPKMTVGYANNLIISNDPTEQEFNFRQSGGGVIEDGVAGIDKVKGNSVVWNQLIPMKASGTTETINGVTITYTDNGFCLQGTATNTFKFTTLGTCNLKKGHKYLTFGGSSGTSLQIELWGGNPIDSRKGQPAIVTISTTPTALGLINIYCFSEEIFVGEELHWQCFDLTQMFGAGNEPTTYEEFLQRKPTVTDEYAYNEGTIVNNKVEKVVTTGRNLWDEEWELGAISSSTAANVPSSNDIRNKNYIPVMPGTTYYCKCPPVPQGTLNVRYYDANKNFLAAFNTTIVNAFTVPSGAHYLRFWSAGTTYNHDICINLSDASFNGQYAPYEKHELDLSWVKEIKDGEGVKLFEDGMRSAGTAFDEAAKGRAIKRFGVKVFDGTEDMPLLGGGFYIYLNTAHKVTNNSEIANAICNLYPVTAFAKIYSSEVDKSFGIGIINNRAILAVRDTSFTVETFKAHLADLYAAGTPLVVYYELAEPIEVEYDEKSLTYPVIAGGTEEAIASEPSSAFRADIGYGIDAVKTILDLKARVKALEGK